MKKHLHALTAWMLIVMLLVSNTVNVMAVEPVTGGKRTFFLSWRRAPKWMTMR